MAQARLEDAEAKLEAARIEPTPSYDVTFRGPTEMVLDQQFAISIEVSIPTGEPPPSDAVFRDSIPAVSQTLRAMLYGSNFEIAYDENQDQSLVAGKAVWDFKVKPVVVGEHTLHATIIQYAPGGTDASLLALRTDSWKVKVVVDAAPRIITAVARNLGTFTIGLITFIGGMIAEFLRRRFFRDAKQSN